MIQDMLRVFIVRIGCLKSETFSVLLQPILLWINEHVSDSYSLSEMDGFKVSFFCSLYILEALQISSIKYFSAVVFRFTDISTFLLACWSIHMPRFSFHC